MTPSFIPSPILPPVVARIQALVEANPDAEAAALQWPEPLHHAIQAHGHKAYTILWVVVHPHLQQVCLEIHPRGSASPFASLRIPFQALEEVDPQTAKRLALVHAAEATVNEAKEELTHLQEALKGAMAKLQKAQAELAVLLSTD